MKIDMLKKTIKKILPLAVLLALSGCSDKSGPAGPAADMVTDSYPLALGNEWEYYVEQSYFVWEDTTMPPLVGIATGRQHVGITSTEMVTGDEAFGVLFNHTMGRFFSTGQDTTMERHYLARRGDKVLLKAQETVYSTGGFIPFSETGTDGGSQVIRLGAKIVINGRNTFVSLNHLARMLLDPAGWNLRALPAENTELASDGVQSRENMFIYDTDYIFVYDELYQGKNWVSLEAQGVGGIEITQKVTNIIPELSGFEGPIAEVEMSNTFIEAMGSEQFKIRYYYKGGVGIVQAEIHDPGFLIWGQLADGTIIVIGIGTWAVVKKLESYTVK